MSNGEGNEAAQERCGLPALESAVTRTLEELRGARRRAADAERRSADLEALLQSFESGTASPFEMKQRLARIEEENRDLRERIARSRETVERLLARIRFLEDQQ